MIFSGYSLNWKKIKVQMMFFLGVDIDDQYANAWNNQPDYWFNVFHWNQHSSLLLLFFFMLDKRKLFWEHANQWHFFSIFDAVFSSNASFSLSLSIFEKRTISVFAIFSFVLNLIEYIDSMGCSRTFDYHPLRTFSHREFHVHANEYSSMEKKSWTEWNLHIVRGELVRRKYMK